MCYYCVHSNFTEHPIISAKCVPATIISMHNGYGVSKVHTVTCPLTSSRPRSVSAALSPISGS